MARKLRIRQMIITPKPDDKAEVMAEYTVEDDGLRKSGAKILEGQDTSSTIAELMAAISAPVAEAERAELQEPQAPASPPESPARAKAPDIPPPNEGDAPEPPPERR